MTDDLYSGEKIATAAQRQRVYELYDGGLSPLDIVELTGFDEGDVQTTLEEYEDCPLSPDDGADAVDLRVLEQEERAEQAYHPFDDRDYLS